MTDKSSPAHGAKGEIGLFKAIMGILSSLIAAGILYVCNGVLDSQIEIAELRVAFARFEAAQDALNANLYTKSDADAAMALQSARMNEMDRNAQRQDAVLQSLSARISALEQEK